MKTFPLYFCLLLTALPAAAVLSPFYGEWDCSQAPNAGERRTCLPHCADVNSPRWTITPARRNCPLAAENQGEDECRQALSAQPPLCCPPGSACNELGLLSRPPCGIGHAEMDDKCVPESGDMPATAEICALFGGLPRAAQDGAICSDADAEKTFCLLSSDSALPCRGLFNQARDCNLIHSRPAMNPFLCGRECPPGQQARGGKCVSPRRADFAYLRQHCPPRRHGDIESFPNQPEENGVYPADNRVSDPPRIGAKCLLSRQPHRLCYALDSAFAELRPEQLKDDNGDLLSNPGFPVYPCDEVLDFCPRGQVDMDGNYFTEYDCSDDAAEARKVDLAHLEAHCPERGAAHPRQYEENRIYPLNYEIDPNDPNKPNNAEEASAGKICELSFNPYRYCYALKPEFVGLQKRDLVDDNDDLLSEYLRPIPPCDDALALCPEGWTDADGNYFTEGDCVQKTVGS